MGALRSRRIVELRRGHGAAPRQGHPLAWAADRWLEPRAHIHPGYRHLPGYIRYPGGCVDLDRRGSGPFRAVGVAGLETGAAPEAQPLMTSWFISKKGKIR